MFGAISALGVDDVSYFGDCSFPFVDRRFCDVQERRPVDSFAGDLRGDIVGATPDYRATRLTEGTNVSLSRNCVGDTVGP